MNKLLELSGDDLLLLPLQSGPLILEPGPLYAIDGDKSLNEKVIYEIAAGE